MSYAYTPETLASLWGVSAATVRNLVRDGALRAFRVGRRELGMTMEKSDDGIVARHGWASLLLLLVGKGLITEAESHQVILDAYAGASKRAALDIQESNVPQGVG